MTQVTMESMDTKQDFSDWECVCGYVNEGIDDDCKRCNRERASAVAELNEKKEAELIAAQKAKLEEMQLEAQKQQELEEIKAQRRSRLLQLEFHGKPMEFLGPYIVIALLSAISFGIYSFWGAARIMQWAVANSTLEGRSLKFTGNGVDVLVLWLLNGLLVSLTFGLYTPWAIANCLKWFNEKVEFAD